MKRSWAGAVLALSVAAGACASGGAGGARRSSGSASIVAASELSGATELTVLDWIRAHRPTWLLRRAPTTLMTDRESDIAVYADETRVGGLDALRQYRPGSIAGLRYYTPSEAQGRFGPGHLRGAIQILTSGPR